MSRPTKPSTPSAPTRRAPTAAESISTRSSSAPTLEQIAARAYEIFIARGAQHGRDQDDGYQAENELRLGKQ